MSDTIQIKVTHLLDQINRTIHRLGSPRTVSLLAATKGQSADAINRYINCCNQAGKVAILGESYLQEWLRKKEDIHGNYEIHYIGRIQRNKIRQIVSYFDVIQSVDNMIVLEIVESELQRINKQMKLFLQVNMSEDPRKGGFSPEDVLCSFAEAPVTLNCCKIAGLMTITKLYDRPEMAREDYRRLFFLATEIKKNPDILKIMRTEQLELSMGMSDDFEVAIEEGATLIRIGRAIFGERIY